MSAYRQQAHIDAPLEAVWGLVGTPNRYPEWWPRVIEVRGERFEEGDEYAQVTKDPIGRSETNFLLERCRDLHEIRMACQLTGMYAHWRLTPAQGGYLRGRRDGHAAQAVRRSRHRRRDRPDLLPPLGE
jgi:hypothetical protein